jgi:ribosomal protein S18 acetylase RimI-like enzyme
MEEYMEMAENAGTFRGIEYRQADNEEMTEEARELFLEYAGSLEVSLCFQGFEKELAELPGKYAPPRGTLILAYADGKPAGCAALRELTDDICEMKRLYVRDSARGMGIGKGLAERIIEEAVKLGYRFVRLDTLPSMEKAQSMYRSLGFREIEPYVFNPVEGTIYMELEL